MSDPIVPASAVEADPRKPYKAYAAFVITLLGTFWAALEGRDTLDNMTLMEWLSIIIPVILTTATVYGIRNPKVVDMPPAGPAGPEIPVDERGAVSPALALIVVGAVLALIGLFAAGLAWLVWVGVILAVVGVVLLLVGSSGNARL